VEDNHKFEKHSFRLQPLPHCLSVRLLLLQIPTSMKQLHKQSPKREKKWLKIVKNWNKKKREKNAREITREGSQKK
jgi:hypothetical protein